MKILCANWMADDEAELERQHFPDVEFVLARASHAAPASLDPELCQTIDAVINYSAAHNVALPPTAFPKARIAVRSGVGYDNIDTAGWGGRGIPACNVPDYGTTEVADHAIALMLALTRGALTYPQVLASEGPQGWSHARAPLIRRHRKAVFGVVGLGRIGLATARRAAAFDMQVRFYDPQLLNGVDLSTGYERVQSLAALVEQSDIVSLHAPLNAATRGMINDEILSHAKPGLILINTARGPIIQLDALERGLRAGKIAGAGLDVLPSEPNDMDHSLLKAWRAKEEWIKDRLVVTPHAAFYSPASMVDLRLKSVEVVYDYLAKGRLTNCVNAELMR